MTSPNIGVDLTMEYSQGEARCVPGTPGMSSTHYIHVSITPYYLGHEGRTAFLLTDTIYGLVDSYCEWIRTYTATPVTDLQKARTGWGEYTFGFETKALAMAFKLQFG